MAYLRSAVAAVLLLIPALAACSSTATTASRADDRAVQTAYGSVEVPLDPKRVAAVSYDTPFQLDALGVQPVATQNYDAFIEEFPADQQAVINAADEVGVFGELDLEKVAAISPDLIVGDAYEIDETTFDKLSKIAPTVIVEGKTRGDWQTITTRIAQAMGKESELRATKKAYTTTLTRLKNQYAAEIADNTWVHMSFGDSESEFSIQEPSGATGDLVVNELGMSYGPDVPPDTSDSGYTSYSLERLGTILGSTDAILYAANADASTPAPTQAILDGPIFKQLTAARNARVWGISTTVTDYVTAKKWLLEVENKALSQRRPLGNQRPEA